MAEKVSAITFTMDSNWKTKFEKICFAKSLEESRKVTMTELIRIALDQVYGLSKDI